MKKLLLTSFLFLAAAGTLVAQNRKPKKMKLQTSKTERVTLQNQRLAQKKAAAANLDKNGKSAKETQLSEWDNKQIERKQAAKARSQHSTNNVEVAPAGNNK